MWLTKRRDGAGATERRAPWERRAPSERRALWERHLEGIRRLDQAPADAVLVAPDPDGVAAGDPLPEFGPSELTAPGLRAAILRDGCMLVRGLIGREDALSFAADIDAAYAARAGSGTGSGSGSAPGSGDDLYEEFEPHERFGPVLYRSWIQEGGGLLAADSPRLCARMLELFERAGVSALAREYLGEPVVISVHKSTLRKAAPEVGGAWHQDGFFMGPGHALNLWLALSRCGDVAPGLDLIPRRIEHYLATGTEGAQLTWTISDREVEGLGTAVVRPVFEPGDALFFDERFLHRTGSDPAMPNSRFAIENWFFGASQFPADYAPIAV